MGLTPASSQKSHLETNAIVKSHYRMIKIPFQQQKKKLLHPLSWIWHDGSPLSK